MRRRMIDPDIWKDEKFSKLDHAGRLLFIGLVSNSNDYGKLRGNPIYLKSTIFPYDENIDVAEGIHKISELGLVMTYQVNGESYIKIKNWTKYQTLTYRGRDEIPEPLTNPEETLNKPLTAREEKLREVKRSKEKSIGAELPGSTPPDPAVLTFPCIKGQQYDLKESKIREYQESFPGIDVLQQCKALRQWCIDNPAKRKTLRGMPAFFSRNLSRAQDKITWSRGTNRNHPQGQEGKYGNM